MGIRQLQLAKAVERIVRSYLSRGRYPGFQTITFHLSQFLREHTPGTPSFSPLKVLRKEKSDEKRYNENVKMIHEDIQDLYGVTIDQTRRIMNDFRFGEVERDKITHELASLSNKIDQLLMVSGNGSQYADMIIESFKDASGINTSNSTAMVNLKSGQVTLKENQRLSARVLLQGSQSVFNALTPNVKQAAIETMDNAFDDNANTAWWHVVKKTGPGVVKAELVVRLGSTEKISEIEYVPHHGKAMLIQVEYSMDGATFTPLPEKNNKRSVSAKSTWSFAEVEAKAIKFTYEKKDHDDQSAGVYNYYFGASQITVSRKNYLVEGVMVSNPFVFSSENINMATLEASHDIPYGSSIDYEIAVAGDGYAVNQLIWYPISSSQETKPKYSKVIEFNARKQKNIEFGGSEATEETINGMRVFKLIKDDKDGTIPESFDQIQNAKLFRGINQWRRERCYVSFDGTIPLNSAWLEEYNNRPREIRIDYLAIGNTLNLRRENGGSSDNMYRFTTCIHSEETKSLPLSLAVIQTISGIRKRVGTYAVYVNGKRLVPSNEEVTLPFVPGWNEIQILYHFGDMQERKDFIDADLPNETLLGRMSFMSEKRVRADKDSLRIVDAHSLYHNISPNNRDYFAIHEKQVVLNYQPKSCIFQLAYEVIDAEAANNQIIVRATLRRDESIPYISPRISNLKIQAK